jgi:hypothetical protein
MRPTTYSGSAGRHGRCKPIVWCANYTRGEFLRERCDVNPGTSINDTMVAAAVKPPRTNEDDEKRGRERRGLFA